MRTQADGGKEGAKERKREANRAAYAKGRADRAHVLPRLSHGALARLDAARAAAGILRSALVEALLAGAALESPAPSPASAPQKPTVGDEFKALFGSRE